MGLVDELTEDPVEAEDLGATPFPRAIRERIITSICEAVPTEMIYVFGSRARGDMRPDSDVDIYVITTDEEPERRAYAVRVRLSLLWLSCDKDVATAPLAAHSRALHGEGHRFLREEVIDKGFLLFSRMTGASDATTVPT